LRDPGCAFDPEEREKEGERAREKGRKKKE